MKKFTLSLFLSVMSCFAICAQSFTISGNPTSPVIGDANDFMVAAECTVHNASNADKMVMCERTVNMVAPGHESSFCWDQCYPPFVSVSSQAVNISAGGLTTAFIADLRPNLNTGFTTVSYKFYDQANPADFVTVDIQYNITALGLNDNLTAVQIASPRPNPANEATYISYQNRNSASTFSLQIADLLGKVYLDKIIVDQAGVAMLETANIPSGVYFVRALSNGKVISTNKLVISHK
ncbi:MAG: T9SS type A sorting domain-containing protein [Bacteroidetes bacterium]|nr:T9SS type A sorting domain-containing protein [Bacteroidota bacterium]